MSLGPQPTPEMEAIAREVDALARERLALEAELAAKQRDLTVKAGEADSLQVSITPLMVEDTFHQSPHKLVTMFTII